MKEAVKNALKTFGIYHPLQSRYRKFLSYLQRSRYRFTYSRLEGKGYTCNNCGRTYARFADSFPKREDREALQRNKVIAGYGYNIICPGCLSTARERLVLAWLHQWNISGWKVLHFSPEKPVSNFLQKHCNLITADLEPGFYKNIDRSIKKENALTLSFSNDSFDLLVANHILEHIPDDRTAIREFFRVLKPGARAILQVPYTNENPTIESSTIPDPKTASRLYGQKDHARIYNLRDYVTRLKETGFSIEVVQYNEMKHLHHFAIQENEDFLVITKPA